MYTVKLSSEEMELLLSALRYTTEYGYSHVDEEYVEGGRYWKEAMDEYHSMYRVYDKLIDERNRV